MAALSLWGSTTLETLIGFAEYPLIVYGEKAITLLNLFNFIIVFIIGFGFGSLYKNRILKKSHYFQKLNVSSRTLVANLGYYLIITLTLLTALNMLGLDLTSLTIVAGALSIGVGFGLQNIVSNFISGIILIFEKSIRVGDYIEISGDFRGRVTDIRMRSVSVRTNDGVEVIVPNQSFIQNNVINWTLSDDTRRLHLPFSVAYGTKVEDVKRAVIEALEASELPYVKGDPEKTPMVWMTGMNSSGVDFALVIWIYGQSTIAPSKAKSDFLVLIYNALYANGITIPFPQLDLHIKKP
jgi:small-conductance mechanosensitive channel